MNPSREVERKSRRSGFSPTYGWEQVALGNAESRRWRYGGGGPLIVPNPFNQPHVDQETVVAAKNDSRKQSKGNNPARRARTSSSADSSPSGDASRREQMIADAAYFRAEQRGFAPGDEMSDWFQAEADVDAMLASGE